MNSRPKTADLINAVTRFADTVIEHGSISCASLFVDALDATTLKWLPFDLADVVPETVLSNFAFHQSFLRLLNGLSDLGCDESYRRVAQKTVKCAFKELTAGNGLLFWGGHAAFDVIRECPVTSPTKGHLHELKCCYPAYEFLWSCDAVRTRSFVEAFWKAHILNWERLHFDRHGAYKPVPAPGTAWDREYAGGPIFFWAEGSTFVNAGSDLYYAAAMLSRLSGDEAPRIWAKRLAARYVETRYPGVEISGYQFSQNSRAWCRGPAVRGDRAQYQYAPLIPPGHRVFESTLFRPVPAVQRCQLRLGECLGVGGQEFLTWALEELIAWARIAYRPESNVFIPMLIDGYSLEGLVLSRDGYFGPKGKVERALFADLDFFWAYARGFCASNDEFLWETLRHIAKANGLGDFGKRPLEPSALNFATGCIDPRAIWGLLAIYDTTQSGSFLDLAARIARNLVPGLLSETIISPADPRPLAILNVAARLLATRLSLSEPLT